MYFLFEGICTNKNSLTSSPEMTHFWKCQFSKLSTPNKPSEDKLEEKSQRKLNDLTAGCQECTTPKPLGGQQLLSTQLWQ